MIIYTYTENMSAIVGLFDGTERRRKRKEE
jgi:hypothetical protein